MTNFEIRNPGDDDRHSGDIGSSYGIRSHSTQAPAADDVDPPGYLGGMRLAPHRRRYLAGAIDYLIVPWLYVNLFALLASLGLPLGRPEAKWYFFVVLVNSVLMQGVTGQSLGKTATGLYLVYPVNDPAKGLAWRFPGILRCWFRFVIHFIDWFGFFFGFFVRPWLDFERQTFADDWTGTVVVLPPRPIEVENARTETGAPTVRFLGPEVPDFFAKGTRAVPADVVFRRRLAEQRRKTLVAPS